MYKPKKLSSSFTMMELIFLIVALGILAAIALPKLADVQQLNSYKQTWQYYKKNEPYSAIAIESFIKTGSIAASIEMLPILGVRSAIIYLSRSSIKTGRS